LLTIATIHQTGCVKGEREFTRHDLGGERLQPGGPQNGTRRLSGKWMTGELLATLMLFDEPIERRSAFGSENELIATAPRFELVEELVARAAGTGQCGE
jgi:hypothetical protein